MKDFYKHYIYFCCAKGTTDLVRNKPVLAHKRMCDKLHIIICHTIGKEYAAGWGASKRLDKIKKDFEYIGGGDIRKLKYLYQGYIYNKVVNSKHEIKETFSTIIEKIDKRYREFCYIGLGEGLFDLVYFKKAEFDFAKNMEMIEEYNPFVEEAYKGYFFQGIGEGLAKMFAQPYSPYITDKGLNDHKILENYFKAINNQECRKAFLAGFCNKDIWSPY